MDYERLPEPSKLAGLDVNEVKYLNQLIRVLRITLEDYDRRIKDLEQA